MLIARSDTRVIGSIMYGYDGHRGWLYRLAVLPDERRKGLGGRLVHAALVELTSAGCAKVNAQFHENNEQGARFWQAQGFALEARGNVGKELRSET